MNENNNNYIPQGGNDSFVQPDGSMIPPGSTVMVMQEDGTLVPQDGSAMIMQADGTYISASDYAALLQQSMNENAVFNTTDTDDSAEVIYCPKCGDPMKKDSRYCLKCGNLNYAHPENAKMKNYAWQSVKKGDYISGINVDRGEVLEVPWKYRYKPFFWCFLANLLLHLGLPILITVLVKNVPAIEFSGSLLPIYLCFFVAFVYNYAMQGIYIKAKERWWSYFIPIYSQLVFFEITMGAGWWFILMLIPGVNIVVMFMSLYRLGKKFGKNGWLTMFFPFVMIPVIGLGGAEINSFVVEPGITQNEVDSKGRTRSEREYKRKKLISRFLIIISIAVIGYLCWDWIMKLVDWFLGLFTESLEFFK